MRNLRLGVGAGAFLAAAALLASAPAGGARSGAGAPPAPLKILAVSTVSANPLTPLTVTVSGLQPSGPVSVRFFNRSGFSVTESAISVTAGRRVVVGVPIYADPASGTTGSGSVSLVVSQAKRSSAARALAIQAIPSAGADNLPVGQVSHDFLVFEALLIGRRLNQLEAAQSLLGVDESQQIAALTDELRATLLARNDVDRVLVDPSTVIPAGSSPSGSPIQFDQNSVATMDSIFESYLLQQFSSVAADTSVAKGAASAPGPIARLGTLITSYDSAQQIVEAWQHRHENSTATTILAMGQGAAGLVQDWSRTKAAKKLAGQFGAVAGALDVYRLTLLEATDLGNYIRDTTDGGNPTAATQDLADMQKHRTELLSAIVPLGCQTLSLAAKPLARAAGEVCSTITAFISDLDSTAAPANAGGPEGLTLLDQEAALVQPGATGADTDNNAVTDKLTKPFTSATQGFAEVSGTADITNGQGVAAAQSSIDYCCFGASSLGIDTLADPSGGYQVYIPLAVPGTDYSSLSVDAVDAITGNVTGSTTADFGGLTSTQAATAPTITGSCTDNDALNPDADDPDCD